MLQVVNNQIKVTLKTIKYGIMREMINKTSFVMKVLFMILNNASFIIQWVVIYSIKDNVGGYTFEEILLLWGIAASTYGFSHFFFKNMFLLSFNVYTKIFIYETYIAIDGFEKYFSHCWPDL